MVQTECDRAIVCAATPQMKTGGVELFGLFEVAPNPVDLADIVESRGDAAGVVEASEELQCKLEVLECVVVFSEASIGSTDLVVRNAATRSVIEHPRKAEHLSIIGERLIVLSEEVIDRSK